MHSLDKAPIELQDIHVHKVFIDDKEFIIMEFNTFRDYFNRVFLKDSLLITY